MKRGVTVEGSSEGQYGLIGSLVMASANCGTLMGGLIACGIRATLTDDQLYSWGWRAPFWAGILVSISGVYLKMAEDGHSHLTKKKSSLASAGNPIVTAFDKEHRPYLLMTTLATVIWSCTFYILFIWMPIFMTDIRSPPLNNAFAITSLVLFTTNVLFFPLAGALSDLIGRRRLMIFGGTAIATLSYPTLLVIENAPDHGQYMNIYCLLAHGTMGLALALYGAPMCAFLVESVPATARLTSISFGYNLAQMMVGGISPAAATIMCDRYGIVGVAHLVSGVAIISVCGVALGPRKIYDIREGKR